MKISLTPPLLPTGAMQDVRWLEFQTQTPVMDVWRVAMPDGRERIARVLFGMGGDSNRLADAVQNLQGIQHPALMPLEVGFAGNGMLILLSDPVRLSVRDRFHNCVSARQPGIPRSELFEYFRSVASALDYLYQQHTLYHLGLSPRKMLLDAGWLQIEEFGFVQTFWQRSGTDLGSLNPRYAAPEVFAGRLHRNSDQYSLALIFAEMQTGEHPFGGTPARTAVAQNHKPRLEGLSEVDRSAITRALDPEPRRRWPSCEAFFKALAGENDDMPVESEEQADRFVLLVKNSHVERQPAIYTGVSPTDLTTVVDRLIEQAGGSVEAVPMAAPERSADGESLHYRFQVGSPVGAVKDRISDFADQIYARVVREDETSASMMFELPKTTWQRWFRKEPSMRFDVGAARVQPNSPTPVEITGVLSTSHCPRKRREELLGQVGPELFQRLQQHLLVNSEKRNTERFIWPNRVVVYPLYANGQRDDSIECRGKDISRNGMGFYIPHDLSTASVLIELPNPLKSTMALIPASLVRAKRCPDGWYEVGALFRMPALHETLAEIVLAH